ncbi:MAG: ribonuclease J [bacterium]|nr:ribonuclease J [bacterium]
MDTIRTTGELEERRKTLERELPSGGVALTFLGGVGEFGKNMLLLEDNSGIVVVDCGQAFPDDTLLGVDSVIPETSYLEAHADRLLAYVFTHCHEDHIGGLPYVLPRVPAPLYGSRLTLGFIDGKLREFPETPDVERVEIKAGRKFSIGGFEFEPIAVSHSTADSLALAVSTRAGVILHTGDFKLDPTPVGRRHDPIPRLRYYGKRGVRLLLSDSTNAEFTGHSQSETVAQEGILEAFRGTRGRIILTTFASHIHRIQGVVDACEETGRSLVVSGRAVEKNVRIAQELGYLRIPGGMLVSPKDLGDLPASRLTLLVSGSQGEPLSALARIVEGEHKHIKLEANDLVIFSARMIPGNEVAIGRLIDRIFLHGARALYQGVAQVHVSGHAYADELAEAMRAAKPEYFIPVHGEYRQLYAHKRLVEALGMDERKILIPHVGARLLLDAEGAWWGEPVPAGRILVDGKGVGDVGPIVLRDRRTMADDGILVIIVAVSRQTGEILREVELVTRGLVYIDENEAFMGELSARVHELIAEAEPEVREDRELFADWLRRKTRRFIQKKLERRPLVVPVIYEL